MKGPLSPALRLFLVRHGEAAANVEMRYLGSRDDPLTDRGVEQAECLARAFERLPVRAVCSSPLRRASATAARIAEACGLEPIRDERLREVSFGDWEGLTRAEVLARSEEDARRLRLWEANAECPAPGGESFLDVQARIVGFVEELAGRGAEGPVVLVSHVGPIKALLAAAAGLPFRAAQRLFLDPATISVVDWGDTPLIRLFNSHAHLGWERARWMRG